MRRADRLFKIIQSLRGRRRSVTAAELASTLEVSERTVYRDIRDLIRSGTPIRGEPGVGYTLHRTYDLPPLMFDEDEVEALVLGVRMAAAQGDPMLAKAAASVLSKVEAVLPDAVRGRLDGARLYVAAPRTQGVEALQLVRGALAEGRKLSFSYLDRESRPTTRRVHPLGAFFWGRTWTLAAWCELREDFRSFRLDRMEAICVGEPFETVAGRDLRDFLARYGEGAVKLVDGSPEPQQIRGNCSPSGKSRIR